jgi:hypothetical protein
MSVSDYLLKRRSDPHLVTRRDPQTPAEWQEAVDVAEFLLLLASARAYGLIDGGPTANSERCEEILKRGRELGYRPHKDAQLCERFLAK